jgi:glycosyltransferase involved in cell wall biosynthesis
MRIAFTTNSLEIGGIERNIVRLCKALTGLGHEVFAMTAGGGLVPALENAGGHHATVAFSPRGLPRAAKLVRRHLRHWDVDLVHNFSASAALGLRAAYPRGAPFPVVASVMGLQNSAEERRPLILARAYATTLGANPILAIAPSIERVLRTLPLRRQRIQLADVVGVPAPTPSAVDEPATSALRDGLGLDRSQRVVTTVGRLSPAKQHDLFIVAAGHIARTHPEVVFLLVGGGPLATELRALGRATGLKNRIRFLGARDDVDTILAASDVCVRPGTVEGFVGITVIEAQMVGTPVVAFATEDVRLSITDGKSGLLVEPHTPSALARAVTSVLDSGTLAAQLAEGGHDAAARFELGAVACRLEDIYRSVIK